MLEIARTVLNGRIFKFATVGASGALVNLLFLYIIREYAGVHYVAAGLLSSGISLTWNFVLNDAWTWGKEKKRHGFLKRYASYAAISFSTILLDLVLLYAFTEYLNLFYLLSMALAILISFLINYALNRRVTFAR